MADSMQSMRERRDALARDTRNLLDTNTHANFGESEQKKYDENMSEIERIDAALDREKRLLDLAADNHFKDVGGREAEQPTGRELYNKWLRGGDRALNADEWAIVNTMSTTTDAEGGFTVQTDVASDLMEALKAYGGMRAVSDVFNSDSGNPLQYPTSDGTSEVGEIIAENTTATALDPSFGSKTLNTYKYSSKIVAVPFELLQDSEVNVEAMIRARMTERLGRITNTHFTTGTGTAQPEGIVTASSAGKTGTTGQTVTVIYDDLVDLQHSVDPSYRMGARWMMADSSVKVIRKIVDGNTRPIFVPGYESNSPGGEPDTLLGTPITVNQDVPAMAANAKSILYGDFNFYKIRDVMNITLFRFTDSAYTKLGQVGFLAWMRTGGVFVDAGGGAVKHYANSAT